MKTKAAPVVHDLRQTLKSILEAELESLPETLQALPPIERANLLLKLMPFVLPKVDNVSHMIGEPANLNWL